MKRYLFLSVLLVSVTSFSQTNPQVIDILRDYQDRITQGGGSISNGDLSAIATFVDSATTHKYWTKLIDIGVLSGNNLGASMVKLKFPVNGAPLIQNNGFLAQDYSHDKGFFLNSSKSLNTITNLSTLNLNGLFGMSMWLEDAGSGSMGCPNSSSPYSILFGSDTYTIGYVGEPTNYAAVGGKISSNTDAFYHLIKQSLTSTKVLIDGSQIGGTCTSAITAQLRNGDIEVFGDASETGRGLFYCIDDGTLSDAEMKQFYYDVRLLMYDLGRKIAPPLISSNGLYSETQKVTILETPTSSSMKGATIYYTLDGTTPTVSSLIYSTPLEVSTTTKIQAVSVKNNCFSKQTDAWVAIVPQGFNTEKYYTAHVMINLLAFTNDMDVWLKEMKASGYNLIWAHLDDYRDNYITTLKSLLDAAVRVGGIQVMPGASWWVEPSRISQMFKDTWDHPGLFRIGNKRIYTGWDYQPDNQHIVDSLLKLQNITKNQYYLWVHSRYPYTYDEGKTWVGEYDSQNGYLKWNGNSFAGQAGDMAHLFETRSQLDGLINFAVDQGDKSNIIRTNKLITQSSLQRGKFSMAGASSFYASVSFSDFGFNGAAEIWDSILALPVNARPTAMSDITANDYAELSYISPLVIKPTNGLSFVPPMTSGFNLGNNIRYPVLDHSGIQKFLRPWAEAFLYNQASPVFPEDRMFAWYWLHPRNQQPNPNLPSEFNGYSHLNQSWWNNTVYASGNIDVGGNNQVEGIKYFFEDGMNKIRMAAHLTSPAQLKINDSLSDIKPAGAAYFEIAMGAFRGTPRFGIIRNGVEIKTGQGLQAITNNAFPGGWNFLSMEIVGTENAANFYRSKVSGNWNNLNCWQSSNDSIKWVNAVRVPSKIENSIVIQNGHTITITDSATVDQLLIQNGGVLNVAHNAAIIINDGSGDDITIAATGKMIIQSDSIGTGRIGNSSGSISGNVTVERYIRSSVNKSYRLLSPSVNTANSLKPFIRDNWQEGQNNTNIKSNINLVPHYGIQITGSTTGANGFDITSKGTVSLFTYNHVNDTPSWIEVTNTNALNLDAKKGYLVLVNGDRSTDLRINSRPSSTTIRATGTVLTGTQAFAKPEGSRGTFLIGNPYPSPIDWTAIYNDASTLNSKNFENYYTYWDTRVGTTGGYVTVNTSGIRSAPTNATTEIQSGQAFLLKIKKGIVSPTLVIKEKHKSTTGNLNVFRMLPQQQLMSSLYFSTHDGTRIMADAVNTVFNNAFSTHVDGNDAEEIPNSEENIAINRAHYMLSIEQRPEIKLHDTLPLAIQRLKTRNYEWQFDPTGFTQPNLQGYLEDRLLNTRIPISLTSATVIAFTVTANPFSAEQDRFRILFTSKERLPIKIYSIKALPKATGIQLDWISLYEGNLINYEIQKSYDGIRFKKEQIIPVNVTGSLTNNYNWLDENPLTGSNYYRVKATDYSGDITYSQLVSAKFDNQNGNFNIYPNPVLGRYITVRFNNVSKGTYNIKVINSSGELIATKVVYHAGGSINQSFPFSASFPAGNYDLQITGNGINFNKQILKK